MKILAILLIHVIGFNLPGSSDSKNFDGTWSSTIYSTQGNVEVVYQFQVEGGNLTGAAFLPIGTFPISQGTISGNTISFIILMDDIRIFHTGYYLRDQLLMSTNYQGNSGQLIFNRVKD